MINTRKELLESNEKIVVISQTLATELFNDTGMLSLAEKLNKKKIILTKDEINEIREVLGDAKPKTRRGRPRIEEENPTELVGHELLKYKNRLWQRQSRERRKKKND